jgi:hypothetical protein
MLSKKELARSRRDAPEPRLHVVTEGETHRTDRDTEIREYRKGIEAEIDNILSRSPQLSASLSSEEQRRTLTHTIISIKQAFVAATKSLLDIGRELYELNQNDPILYQIAINTPGMLPFNRPTATKYMRIWKAVGVDRTFRDDELPSSVFNAYKIVSWKADVQALARERGLIRCDAQRAEILSFEAEVGRIPVMERGEGEEIRSLRFEQARLEVRRDDLQDELERIDTRLVEIRDNITRLSRPS